MSLSIGIVGLPNVGKSTLFEAITKKQVERSNYPFCTIDPNVGVVAVPDKRVDELVELTNSAKKVYTIVEFVDIAGLVKGASKGEGLGNKFLANIREVNAIIYVLRCFENEKIINTQSSVDILRDKEILDMEMIVKDLDAVEKRIQSLEKDAKTGDKEIIKELEALKRAESFLGDERLLIEQDWDKDEKRCLNKYQFLTLKPRLYLLNGEEKDISENVLQVFEKNNWRFVFIDVLAEFEAMEFKPEERASLGLPIDLRLDVLIKESYELLDLITFFTTGPDETRAWTLKRGATAPQAGGVIHSDFENCFIKADVINSQELINVCGFVKAKEKGLINTVGKGYIVQDGDVIEIKAGA
ncbi:redox-regulated ATPase YchF [Candidatus Parcubacteria bacterium]|nr:redox-regulated ATPase YchF [Candidatus Parcubacteria bacterium]